METWFSIWEHLLVAAATAAARAARNADPLPDTAGAVVLSRACWEAFTNEFLEWRALPSNWKKCSFQPKLSKIYAHLTPGTVPSFDPGTPYGDLQLLNELRNHLIHHQATRVQRGTAPSNIMERLLSARALSTATQKGSDWERRALCPEVARWACRAVGSAILELESVPAARNRSSALVRGQVETALQVIVSRGR
jgi:hypothetical protein